MSTLMRPSSVHGLCLMGTLTLTLALLPSRINRRRPRKSSCLPLYTPTARGIQRASIESLRTPVTTSAEAFPLFGAEEAVVGFIAGKRKVTDVAHAVWKNVIQKGDIVVDATCGNGHDTLAMLKMIADESRRGCVYGMDIQTSALESTSSLLEESVDTNERELVKLFLLCHSKMEDIVPKVTPVRLIAFNLGYLPGGDKKITTTSSTTLMALQAAARMLSSEGLISMVVYVGHPGGREELDTVLSFASNLPFETWVSSKFEMLNQPASPVLVFLHKK